MLSGYLAAFLFLICLTAGIFLFGYAARKTATIKVTFLEIVLGLFLITAVLIGHQQLSFKQLFTTPSLYNWMYLGLAAVTGTLGGNYFSLLNLKWGGETLNSLLSPAITATVVLFSVVADKAFLAPTQICGIVLTLVAVLFFLWFNNGKTIHVANHLKAIWSSFATITCISATIIFSIKGGTVGNLSIFHTLWLRLLLALPFVTALLIFSKERGFALGSKFYAILLCAVTLQTVAGSYLWFAASFRLGVPLFQTIVATLPLCVYATDVYLLKRSKSSFIF